MDFIMPFSFSMHTSILSIFYELNQFVRKEVIHRNVSLKNLVVSEFRAPNNDTDLCSAICNSVMDRCKMCIEKNGEQLEQFR